MEVISPEQKNVLGTLYNATVTTMRGYQKDNSASKLKDWEAAAEALEKYVKDREVEYIDGSDTAANVIEALLFLKEDGWSIKKSKLYQAVKDGKLKRQVDGTLFKTDILAYAAQYCDKVKAGSKNDNIGKYAEQKAKEELRKVQLHNARQEFEMAKEKKQYILRSQYLAELVSKLSASKFIALKVARNKAPDLIAASGGDLKKEAVFVELFSDYIENAFNELVMVPELRFIVQDERNKQ
jgi:hypothetical protein